MITTVLFDLGGVIVRTEDRGPRMTLAEEYGMDFWELSDIVYRTESARMATLGRVTAEEHWKSLQDHLELADEEVEVFERRFWGGDELDETLVEFIRDLNQEYTTALLSNAWDNLRTLMKELWEIDQLFDHVFISAELNLAKPDDRIYQHVIQELGVPPSEIVFLDDFKENVRAARENGLHAIHYRNREQGLAELRELLDQTDLDQEASRGV
jgi:epoxide hydrolase-like predicted phosphatase